MKRGGTGTPALSWSLISRNSSETLEACLMGIRRRTPNAEIVVVDTMSNDFPTSEEIAESVKARAEADAHTCEETQDDDECYNGDFCGFHDNPIDNGHQPVVFESGVPKSKSIALQYADVFEEYAGPKGTWTREMAWFDDAAAARNRSFELATGTWKGWIDADDLLPEPQAARALLRANGAWSTQQEEAAKLTTGVPLEFALSMAAKAGIECIWAPYLYRFAKANADQLVGVDRLPENFDAAATTWQMRERFVRGDAPWTWRGEAHEILVPTDAGHAFKDGEFTSLLFVHLKKFTDGDQLFAIGRHYDVLTKKLARDGKLSTQEYLYLVSYAPIVAPGRTAFYVEGALDAAVMPLDHVRARCAEAQFYASEGFFLNAMQAVGAATVLLPDLPEAWLVGGQILKKAEQWSQAADWFAKAASCPAGGKVNSCVPRDQFVLARLEAAECYWKLTQQLRSAGNWDAANASLEFARVQTERALSHPSIGLQRPQAERLMVLLINEIQAHQVATKLGEVRDYLVRNDETDRAAQLAVLFPHNIPEWHPEVKKTRALADKVDKHLSDPAAYQAFYEDQEAVGAIPTDEEAIVKGHIEQRVHFLIETLRAKKPNASVIEFGCFDGNIGLPVLLALPDVTYTGVEAQQSAIDRFTDRAERHGVRSRLVLRHSLEAAMEDAHLYDAAVFYEVIEHVSDPVGTVKRLLSHLAPDGLLFLSTPWGSFDRGQPANMDKRDPRGHVRALMPNDLHRIVNAAGGRIVEQGGTVGLVGFGATMHACVKRMDRTSAPAKTVAFYVASALWDWNASSLVAKGMGASEETIVHVARQLASRAGRRTTVFGPIPEDSGVLLEETRAGVQYRERDAVADVDPRGVLVVSRSPSSGAMIEQKMRDAGKLGKDERLDKILWLQDTTYPDLNEKTAEDYRKVVVLTGWHKTLTMEQGVPEDKIEVIGNFLLAEQFGRATHGARIDGFEFPKRRPHHFIYASSPDRGLIPLLRMWPKIRSAMPDATLDIFYGWEGCMKLGATSPEWITYYRKVRSEYIKLRYALEGVTDRGMVSHAVIAQEMMRAAAYLYPGDPRTGVAFAETFCVHPDTMVSVPGDHRTGLPTRVRIADLAGKSNVPVYSYDAEENRFRIATMKWCAQTKIADEMVAITLDDGQVLRCTPDHRVMNFDLEWVNAGDLKVGDRLNALHHRYDVMIKDANGSWVRESRLVGEWMAQRKLASDEHVDHLDPLRLDNRPEALQILTASDHFKKTHAGKQIRKGDAKKVGAAIANWHAENPEASQQRVVEGGKARQAGMTAAERARMGKKRSKTVAAKKASSPEYVALLSSNGEKAAAAAHRAVESLPQAEREAYHASRMAAAWATRREKYGASGRQNHKVAKIERIAGGPVFDMEVEGLHNFIADGVVVHNCSNAIKARAAGCVMVCSPYAGLLESAKCDETQFVELTQDEEAYEAAFVDAVRAAVAVSDEEREGMAQRAAYDWDVNEIMLKWRPLMR